MSSSSPQPASGDRHGLYLHFEMGVSWNPRNTNKNRQISFVSKGMRHRASQFPRQLPPANTNFLAAPPNQQPAQQQHYYQNHPHHQLQHHQHQHQRQHQHQYHHQNLPHHASHNQPPAQGHYYHSPPQPQHTAIPVGSTADWLDTPSQPGQQRNSRSRSRSSHERGRSAPPPLNESPWDAEPEPMGATALPRRKAPQVWKALPATPGQYRLGEDGMPWSPSMSYPTGYVEDDEVQSIAGPSTRHPDNSRPVDDRERGRVTEIESLATALMTVDNGFEDQWWNQGPRLVNIAGDLISTAAMRDLIAAGGTVGWAIADGTPLPSASMDSARLNSPQTSSMIDIVSPMSEFASPVSLRRSLTTRSDELHM